MYVYIYMYIYIYIYIYVYSCYVYILYTALDKNIRPPSKMMKKILFTISKL